MDETEWFDVVIVGSGFGGSVTAYKLAQGGLKVCLLERGQIYPPGSFPRSPVAMQRNFWDPSEGLHGLFNVWSFKGLEAIVASGLGGGSLLYANVLLRKDERWFVREDLQKGGYENWPVSRADLDPHYDAVEKVLNAQEFPLNYPPYNQTKKTVAFRAAAEVVIGRNPDHSKWFLPNLAVTFANPQSAPFPGEPIPKDPSNLHGRQRYTCTLCGECDIGCNFGSKNTLDHNYLSMATQHGAVIRVNSEVRTLRQVDSKTYEVGYVVHDPQIIEAHDTAKLPVQIVRARRLILAAGTLGSTYLLLKNRSSFPQISKKLGSRFSGNGDFLGFAIGARRNTGKGRMHRNLDASVGPVITSALQVDADEDGGTGRGHYIQDAGYPQFVNWVLQTASIPLFTGRIIGFGYRYIARLLGQHHKTDLGAEISHTFGVSSNSYSSMPLLGMGRDFPDGIIWLDKKYLEVTWRMNRSQSYFNEVRKTCKHVAMALGATFQTNPCFYISRSVTVHPLGGCPMAKTVEDGVVNAWGEVFNYPGMFIADGSVMPGPVGANPSLTIAALADRFATGILKSYQGPD